MFQMILIIRLFLGIFAVNKFLVKIKKKKIIGKMEACWEDWLKIFKKTYFKNIDI